MPGNQEHEYVKFSKGTTQNEKDHARITMLLLSRDSWF